MSSKKRWRERERVSEWCVVDIRTHVCITKKSICFSIHSSFLLSRVCFFFWHFSSVFLSFSCPPPYRYSSILEPQCFLSIPCLVCVCEWWEKGERNDEGATQWCEMLVCVCVRALIDYIFYLSTTMMRRTRKTLVCVRARATIAGLLRVDPSCSF